MANFLVNSPSSETVGTNTSDLFDLEAIQGVSVFGVDGADTITASADMVASAARLNAGKGADTIILSGGSLENSEIFAGMGKDLISAGGEDFTSTVIRGGAGNDILSFSATIVEKATINGNDMADKISAQFALGTQSSFIGAGAGKDTLSAVFVSGAAAVTLAGGAGHDVIQVINGGAGAANVNNTLSSIVVNGGAGFDTLSFGSGAASTLSGNFKIDGGTQADQITFSAGAVDANGTATIAGGAGADTIAFSATLDLTNGVVDAGLGNDSVNFGAAFTGGTVNGGEGADTITLATFGDTGGTIGAGAEIFGDAGADKFNLGSVTYAGVTGAESGGTTLGFASFDQSNLSAYDFASAAITNNVISGGAANIFTINQSVVTATIANSVGNPASFTGMAGIGTFTSTFATDLTARVAELDRILVAGQTIAFTADATSAGQNFVFIQGGAAGSGSDNDLLIRTNTLAGGFNVKNNTAISVQTTARIV